ncbi:MAG: energy transducer TonB [Chloracidobacterium sp.]|nr:energy transducer TonB [Chloracidobacterium sp.]
MLQRDGGIYGDCAYQSAQGDGHSQRFFSAEGRLSGIKVVRGLPDGLTRRAINALKRVRFSPASLNGAPVGLRDNIEFDFK